MVMFSFCNKINHIFRTTNILLLNDLIEEFTKLKNELFLLTSNQPSIPSLHLHQASLPIDAGGLGLTNSNFTSNSATIASFLQSYESILYHFPNTNFSSNDNYKYIFDSINYCRNHVIDSDVDDFIFDKLITNYSSSHQPTLKIQNIITKKLQNYSKKIFIEDLENIPGCKYLAWYTSVSNSSSGAFLAATPKNNDITFSNNEYSTALSLRLHLPLVTIPLNKRCICKNNAVLDLEGHHLLTGCKENGLRQSHHKTVQIVLNKIFNDVGLQTTIEQNYCFIQSDPMNRCRPDITIHNPQVLNYNNELLIDVSLTSPLEGTQKGEISNLSVNAAKTKFRSAEIRSKQKLQKYNQIASDNHKSFLPFILETSGSILPNSLKILKDTARIGAERHQIPFNIYYNFIMKNLSCLIQKSFSNKINYMIKNILIPETLQNSIQKNINNNVGIDILNIQPHYQT
jgi:hypothetical protein